MTRASSGTALATQVCELIVARSGPKLMESPPEPPPALDGVAATAAAAWAGRSRTAQG
jgi:hypothetical protein